MSRPIWIFIIFIFIQSKMHAQESDFTSSVNFNWIPLDSPTPEPSGSNMYEIVESCAHGEIYDGILNQCRLNCSGNLTYNSIVNTCVKDNILRRIKKLGPCTNLTIDKDYFTMDSEDRLVLTKPSNTTVFTKFTLVNRKVIVCYPFSSAFLTCPVLIELEADEFDVKDGGLTLLVQSKTTFHAGEFILYDDGVADVCPPDSWNPVVDDLSDIKDTIKIIALIISVVSIGLALTIYAIIYPKPKYHTKVIISHMVSLLMFYIATVCFIFGVGLMEYWDYLCYTYVIVQHYCLLASFFWLNVMAYDIWRHLPKVASAQLKTKRSDALRFLLKSLYAWGCPAVIVVAAHLVDQFGSRDIKFKPHFVRNCGFTTMLSKAVFMSIPAGIIIAVNLLFFIMTILSVRKMSKGLTAVNKKIHQQLIKMVFKLLIIMGLCWTTEIISSFLLPTSIYWILTDTINALQGFFLFIIYILTRSVLKDIATFCRDKCGAPCAGQDGCMPTISRQNSSYSTSSERASSISELPQYFYDNGIAPKKITPMPSA